MYRTLDPAQIVTSLERLTHRIDERFPGAGLAAVCTELTEIAEQTTARVEKISRPAVFTRVLIAALLLVGFLALALIIRLIVLSTKTSDDLFGVLQGIEATFNITVLISAATYFLVSLEKRQKRRRALKALHELRSIIHVIDMHQLTKDPAMAVSVSQAMPQSSPKPQTTPSSPDRTLTLFELSRYLDYCSEMLSLTAKIAVLYAQSLPSPTIIEVVNDIERTTASLSQKIWQKINIVDRTIQHEELMARLVDRPDHRPAGQA
jgi:hypothetical protein